MKFVERGVFKLRRRLFTVARQVCWPKLQRANEVFVQIILKCME